MDCCRSEGALLRRDDGLVVKLEEVNGLYILRTLPDLKYGNALLVQEDEENAEKGRAKEAAVWHFGLGRMGTDAVQRLFTENNEIPRLEVASRFV